MVNILKTIKAKKECGSVKLNNWFKLIFVVSY